MISTSTIFTALLLSAAAQVRAANDWAVPCTSGQCSYDVASKADSVPASIRIWGTNNAISDLTEAGGWMLMDCDTSSSTQQVRAVCKSTDTESAGCTHITQGGADGTVVRLPESCGKAPFAVVSGWGTANNQTVNADIAGKIDTTHKRAKPVVHTLTLSSQFGQETKATHAKVNFAIVASTAEAPHAKKVKTRRGMAVTQRSLLGDITGAFGSAKSAVEGAADKATSAIVNVATEAASAVVGGATAAATAVTGAATNAANAASGLASDANNVSVGKNLTLPPIDVTKSVNIVDANVDCGSIGKLALKVDADVTAHADVSVGVNAAGTLIPPAFTAFALTSGLSGSVEGALTFSAGASGAPLDTGSIQLFSVGIPGFDIPDILELGPTFNINGRVTLDVAAEVDMKVGLNFDLNNVAFSFPPSASLAPTGDSAPQDSNLDLSFSPNITADGSLSAHIIPSIAFGINAFVGKAKANVNFNVDTSATAKLTADAGAKVTQDIPTRRADVATDLGGCFDLTAGVDAEVGADADLFGLFNVNKNFPVFTKNFQLFQKCFGSSAPSKRTLAIERALAARDATTLTCPIAAAAPAETAVSAETIAADAIKAI